MIVKKILIIILFSIIPEARYKINIIKNSIEPSPPEKTYGKGRNLSLGGSLCISPGTRIYASSYRPEPLPKYSPVNRLQNYNIIFYEKCQEFFIFTFWLTAKKFRVMILSYCGMPAGCSASL